MKNLGVSGDLLLQKHIRRGKIDVSGVVIANVLLALVVLVGTSFSIKILVPENISWLSGLWFMWGFFGAAISHSTKLKGMKDLLISFPAHLCTYVAAYTICGVYWVFAKVFIKE